MPFIDVKTNRKFTFEEENLIKEELGNLINIFPNKSERYLMINLTYSRSMYFSGTNESLAYVEVKLYKEVNKEICNIFTKKVTDLISNTLRINIDRIYVSYFFTNIWGFCGENF